MNPYSIRLMMLMSQMGQPYSNPLVRQTAMDFPEEQGGVLGAQQAGVTREQLLSAEARKAANREGLGALGIALLKGAPTGDYAGSLAEGLAAMAATRNQRLNEEERRQLAYREEGRQASQEERQRQESQERILAAQQAREQSGTTFGRQQEVWEREDARRAATGRSAVDTVAGISAVVGPDSPEVKRAKALAELGEDADLDRLDKLYEDVIARQRFPEDARRKAEAEIAEIQAKVKAGAMEDPLAAGRRSDRALDIQARQSDLYAKSLDERTAPGGKMPTVEQIETDIKVETDARFNAWKQARMAGIGERSVDIGTWIQDPANKGKMPPTKQPPGKIKVRVMTQDGKDTGRVVEMDEMEFMRRKFEKQVREEMLGRLQAAQGIRQDLGAGPQGRHDEGERLSIPGDPNPDRPLSQRVADVESVLGPLSPAERAGVEAALRTQLPRDVVESIRRRRAAARP